jgi:hypothetical protein
MSYSKIYSDFIAIRAREREERGSHAPHGDARQIQHEDEADARAEREIVCAACRSGITRHTARVAVNGAHVHIFKNPSAIDYTIGCFTDAHGCAGGGDPSTVWTWFPGFAWRVAVCGACGTHVGWSFEGSASRFWGLILDRLRD